MADDRDQSLPFADKFYIDGEWVKPSSTATLGVRDSMTEEVFMTVAEAQAEDIDRAVSAARRAFDHGPWPRLSHAERADWLLRIADAWEKRAKRMGDIWTSESGVLNGIARHASGSIADVYRYYAGLAGTFAWEEEHPDAPDGYTLMVREPVGVVAAIIPWNGPAGLMAYKTAPALLAGCTMIVKGSPEAPSAPYLLAEMCDEIGLPPGVINILTADREVSELLVRDPRVDKVSFTGSTAAGRQIGSICGGRVARYTLELGGKSPGIILDDYDLSAAAESLSQTARFLTGQICSSLTRLIVSRKRQNDFADALAASFSKVRVGDPFDPATEMGPLAIERQRTRVEMLIGKGVDEGARLVTGGGRPSHLNRGYYIEPTVFADVDNRSTIAREEIFGPVLSIIPVDSEEEAIAVANDTEYGLNASIFTNDADKMYSMGRQILSGMVGQNGWKTDFGVSFGGFKQSGVGREGGTAGLIGFTESKTMIFSAPYKRGA